MFEELALVVTVGFAAQLIDGAAGMAYSRHCQVDGLRGALDHATTLR